MQQTLNYHLKLPEGIDYINSEDYNENMETIDEIALLVHDETQYKKPVGSIMFYAGSDDPKGWLICNGRPLQTNLDDQNDKYKLLYSLITLNPASTGIVNFQIPDLRRRFPLGKNSENIGTTGGNEKIKLTISEIPNHFHYYDKAKSQSINSGGTGNITLLGLNPNTETTVTGGDRQHNNMPPFCVVNYIIKY